MKKIRPNIIIIIIIKALLALLGLRLFMRVNLLTDARWVDGAFSASLKNLCTLFTIYTTLVSRYVSCLLILQKCLRLFPRTVAFPITNILSIVRYRVYSAQ